MHCDRLVIKMMKSILFALVCLFASASAFAPVHTKTVTTELNIVPLKRPDIEYTYEDGLTDLERSQRSTLPAFLTGSAKSNIDPESIRDDFEDLSFEFPAWASAVGSVAGTFIFFALVQAAKDPTTYIN